nr:reverse transcriptase domain-containing protein [Tanacetum cinerariifolium]
MDKIHREKRKEVHARLDFGEGSRERRIREGSHYSSAKPCPRGHQRQNAFDRLSKTYSPSTTKFRLDRTSLRDCSRDKSRPHRWDSFNGDLSQGIDCSSGIGESYDNSHSSYGTNHGYRYRDRDRSRRVKRGRDSESPLSRVSESSSSDRGHWKLKSKRHKPINDDDLTMPWMCEEVNPFTPESVISEVHVERWEMPTWCHMFNSTIIGAVRLWFDELPPESIDSYKDLKTAFLAYFMQQKKYVKYPIEIHDIKQKDGETIEDFMEWFKVETRRMKGSPKCMRIFKFIDGVNNKKLTKCLNEHVPKTMEEMMITTTAFVRREAAAAGKKKGITFPSLATSSGTEGSLVIEAEISRDMIHHMYVDGGSSTEALGNNRRRQSFYKSMDEFHDCKVIITVQWHHWKTWNKKIQAVPSTAHGMLKFLADRGIVTIRSTILIPAECAMVITSSKEIPKEAGVHHENFKDCYPLPEIDWKVESLCAYPFKCFLDAYKGYHQIQLAESDEEKTTFHTGQKVYCYTKMPFGLKNAGTTYQRVVDKAFDYQIAKRLRRYFQAHLVVVITNQPIKQIMSCPNVVGRLQKWSVMLREHNITYRLRTSVKGQVLADFLVEMPDESPPDASVVETQQEPWTLFTDRSSCVDGSGAGLILTSPEGTKFTYALRFKFAASNNEAEYETLIAGLWITSQMRVCNVYVLVEIFKEKSIQKKEVTTVVEEHGPTWMTPIIEYLKERILLDDRKEASKLRIKARQYELLEGVLYRRSFLTLWLRPGDFVYRSNEASHAVDGGKLGLKWEGPYEVTEALGDGAYKLRSADEMVLLRIWNAANLKKCYL